MLNIAICDDDKLFLKNITRLTSSILEELNIVANISAFTDGNKIISDFKQYADYYNILILDIDMPAISGKYVAEQLRLINSDFRLIFVTSYDTEVYNVLKYDVDAFICKAQIQERLKQELTRVINCAYDDTAKPAVFEIMDDKQNKKIIKISLKDILYFECINKRVYMHTNNNEYQVIHNNFEEIKEQYLQNDFVPIHRTCIINVKYIFSINDIDVELDNKQSLPLSRRYKKNVVEKFTKVVKEEVLI